MSEYTFQHFQKDAHDEMQKKQATNQKINRKICAKLTREKRLTKGGVVVVVQVVDVVVAAAAATAESAVVVEMEKNI